MLNSEIRVEKRCSKIRQIQKNFPIFLRERLTKADSDLLEYARGSGCKTTSHKLVPQIMIKIENGVRTHNIVDICDVDEMFGSGKAIKISSKPEKKTRNVLKTFVVDVKKTKLDKRKFHESPHAELNLLKQKIEAARTNPQEILQAANEILDKDTHERPSGD